MTVRLALGAAMLLLCSCGEPPPLSATAPASDYNALPAPDRLFDNPDAVIAFYLSPRGIDSPATRVIDVQPEGSPANLVLTFSAQGYADDSLAGEEWRVALGNPGMGYRVLAAGVRYRCVRDEPGRWRRPLCP